MDKYEPFLCPEFQVRFQIQPAAESWLEELDLPLADWLKHCTNAKAKHQAMPGACPFIESELQQRGC
jgi:DNA-binding helix-hairpin-helix protein with protein kinase domain